MRSEMFEYFRRAEYQVEPIEFQSLDMVFEEEKRAAQALEDMKFRMSGGDDPLCEICNLRHPKLQPNPYKLECEAEEAAIVAEMKAYE